MNGPLRLFLLCLLGLLVSKMSEAGLKKDAEYDAFVVSYGGSGCTSTIKRVAESHGSPPAPRLRVNVFNNNDRVKHAYPEAVLAKTPRLTYGIVYVFGNMTNAVKSLCRRHFMRTQISLMAGDGHWADAQTYAPFPTEHPHVTRPLFRKKPKWEEQEDWNVSAALPPNGAPRVVRLRRVLAQAGKVSGQEPIGLWRHFHAWRTAAESGQFPYSILFVNIATTGNPDYPTYHKLKHFSNATVDPGSKVLYHPTRRKGGDVLDMAVGGARGEERAAVLSGVRQYDAWTREMSGYDGRFFPGKGQAAPAWAL